MIGERSMTVGRSQRQPGETARLIATEISFANDEAVILNGVNIAVRGGEILGVAGVAGAAQPVLASILAGTLRPTHGRIVLNGTDITADAQRAARLKLASIPDERAAGLVPALSIATNASLLRLPEQAFRRVGLRRLRQEIRYGGEICRRFAVRPPAPKMRASALSGGNQQKLLLGRELDRDPIAVVAHSPTQGLDLAATAAVRNTLIEAAGRGAAVVVISADLDELIAIADRMVVLSAGKIVDELDLRNEAFDAARIGKAIAVGQHTDYAA
jgi:ABC-type uncharacterized transport system ATPase subunit